MNEPQRFRYPSQSILKDYGQAAAGVVIFGTPLILAGTNIYVAVIFGGIVLMFLGFAFSTWRRQNSVIVVTDDGIGIEGARNARITWRGVDRVELRYFSTRRRRSRDERGDEGNGWMQLRLDGERTTLRIDSALEGFDVAARQVAEAIERFDLKTTPATRENFASLGLAPSPDWAQEG